MISALPLMLVPFVLYNLAMFGAMGAGGIAALDTAIISLPMVSGALLTLTLGDFFILVSLVLLFVEILRATRNDTGSLVRHMLSLLIFSAFVLEFLLVRDAATQPFFILMTIALVDVIGVFAVSIRTADRNMSIGL